MRNSPAILVLLLFAGEAFTAAMLCGAASSTALDDAGPSPWLWGLALAQVQLAIAVFVAGQRWFLLKLALVAGSIALWSIYLTPANDNAIISRACLVLLGTALMTAACCAAVALRTATRGQFSLATLLLCMTIAGVYAGLVRTLPAREAPFFTLQLCCSLPGCAVILLATTIRYRYAPLVIITLVLLALYQLPLVRQHVAGPWLAQSLAMQISFLAFTVLSLLATSAKPTSSSPVIDEANDEGELRATVLQFDATS